MRGGTSNRKQRRRSCIDRKEEYKHVNGGLCLQQRLWRAVIIVGIGIGLIITSGFIIKKAKGGFDLLTQESTPFEKNGFGIVFNEEDFQTTGQLPDRFTEELFTPSDFSCNQLFVEGNTIGLIIKGAPIDIFSQCSAQLENKGWIRVESGLDTSSSFIKAEGAFTWLLLSCYDISGETSLVVQVA